MKYGKKRPVRSRYAVSSVRKDLRVAVRKKALAGFKAAMEKGDTRFGVTIYATTWFVHYRRPIVPVHQRLTGGMRQRKRERAYIRKDGASRSVAG